MVDKVSGERRSAIMRSVRNKNTSPEILVRRAAHRLGLRFRLHDGTLPGRPDLVLRRWRAVVFVNGCFWHRHGGCALTTNPKTNAEFWKEKFRRNIERDAENYIRLAELRWRVIVVWQCEVSTFERAISALRTHFAVAKVQDD